MDVRLGQIIDDHRLISCIYAGGRYVEVYRAENALLEQVAVVKIFKQLDGCDPSWHRVKNAIMQEAFIQARLNHPNIPSIYTYRDLGKIAYIAMEFVDGLPIDQILTERGRRPPLLAATYFFTIAKAIQYIHEQGLIHREITPDNIGISSIGPVKFLFSALARASFSGPLPAHRRWLGTIDYLAPKLVMGNPASIASDMWVLGVSFCEMLTGQKAFTGETDFCTDANIINADYTPPS